MKARFLLAAAFAILLGAGQARAEGDPVKIGILVTLSGPGAVLGQQARDGFLLALKQRDGKLGGRPARGDRRR